jgi:hypothetical protein
MPPNPALGGARVEAYISRKVSKLESGPAMPSSPPPVEAPAVPSIDTHAANVFLGSIVDGTLLQPLNVQVIHTAGNRDAWTVQNPGDWNAASDRRPSFVVSIGDRASFPAAGLAPAVVRLAPAPAGMTGLVIGSTKGDKDWKADQIGADMTEGTSGVWNVKPSKDLKPGDYAIIMRPSNSKALAPQLAWAFSVK